MPEQSDDVGGQQDSEAALAARERIRRQMDGDRQQATDTALATERDSQDDHKAAVGQGQDDAITRLRRRIAAKDNPRQVADVKAAEHRAKDDIAGAERRVPQPAGPTELEKLRMSHRAEMTHMHHSLDAISQHIASAQELLKEAHAATGRHTGQPQLGRPPTPPARG